MGTSKYYKDELDYLREWGPSFASSLAAPAQDPDVERLLEGFAFLTGRIREKLDDEFPELSQGLINLLWPNLLRPLPSMAIVRFAPNCKRVRGRTTIDRGAVVESSLVEDTACRFRTAFPVDLYPFSINSVRWEPSEGLTALRVGFQVSPRVSFEDLKLQRLRLYLHGSRELYFWLRTRVERISVEWDIDAGVEGRTLHQARVEPVGFDEDSAILPYPGNAFPGYRLLQEYFALPEKFLFVDVTGLDDLACMGRPETFRLIFLLRPKGAFGSLAGRVDDEPRLKGDSLQLYCTPVVNLFAQPGRPITLDHKRVEYPVMAASGHAEHVQVFSIDQVRSSPHSGNVGEREKAQRQYVALESRHLGPGRRRTSGGETYRVSLKPRDIEGYDGAEQGGDGHRSRGYFGPAVDTYLSFELPPGGEKSLRDEVVSLELTCTNGQLAGKLGIGDIRVATDSSELATLENITQPTPSVAPPLNDDLAWRLVSNLSFNYGSLTDNPRALKEVIRCYDFAAFYNALARERLEKRLGSIVGVQTRAAECLFRGVPVRGLQTRLDMSLSGFDGHGDLYLFGSVLSAFFAQYANVNSYHRLSVRVVETEEEPFTWPATTGSQPAL